MTKVCCCVWKSVYLFGLRLKAALGLLLDFEASGCRGEVSLHAVTFMHWIPNSSRSVD